MQNEFEEDEKTSLFDEEIGAVTCVIFILIIFIIVPFTVLSPFHYPQRSYLDGLLSVNGSAAVTATYPTDEGLARGRANDAFASADRMLARAR